MKKIVACSLIAAMAASPAVFAADETNEVTDTKIDGAGAIVGWVETDQFLVTLPTVTADNLKFTIDPQGLLKKKADITKTEGEGTVTFLDSSKFELTNKSSYDVAFNVTLTLKSNDDKLNVVEEADIDNDADKKSRNIYIAATPLDSNGDAIDGSEIAIASDTAVSGIVGTKSFGYALPDASSEYIVKESSGTYTYELKSTPTTSNFKTVAFEFEGAVSKDGDWSGYAKATNPLTMSLEVSYTVAKLDGEYDDLESSSNISTEVDYLYLDDNGDCAEAPLANVKPSAPSTAEFESGFGKTGVYFTEITGVSLGKGNLATTGITSVKMGTTATAINTAVNLVTAAPTSATVKACMYDSDTSTLKVYGPIIAANAANGTKAYLKITFDDNTEKVIELVNKK